MAWKPKLRTFKEGIHCPHVWGPINMSSFILNHWEPQLYWKASCLQNMAVTPTTPWLCLDSFSSSFNPGAEIKCPFLSVPSWTSPYPVINYLFLTLASWPWLSPHGTTGSSLLICLLHLKWGLPWQELAFYFHVLRSSHSDWQNARSVSGSALCIHLISSHPDVLRALGIKSCQVQWMVERWCSCPVTGHGLFPGPLVWETRPISKGF